jgi:hypothetical protein
MDMDRTTGKALDVNSSLKQPHQALLLLAWQSAASTNLPNAATQQRLHTLKQLLGVWCIILPIA